MAKHKVEMNMSLTGVKAVQAGLGKVKEALGGITGFASRAVLGIASIAGVLSIGSFVAGIKNIADLGGGLSDLSSQTGLTVKEVMIFQQAFKDAGISIESLSIAVSQLDKNLATAKLNGGDVAKSFKRIGVDLNELSSLSSADRFLKVSNAISSLGDETIKTQTAMVIFGKSGAKLKSLWADPLAFQKAERILGRMPALVEKNAELWDSISDSLGNIGIKSQQFFAGFLSQSDTAIRRLLDMFEGLDFTGLGEKFGGKFKEAFLKIANGDLWGGFTSGMSAIWSSFKTGFEIVTDIGSAAFKDINVYPLFESLSALFAELIIKFPVTFWKQFFKIGKSLGERAGEATNTWFAQQNLSAIDNGIKTYSAIIERIESGKASKLTAQNLGEYKRKLAILQKERPLEVERLQQNYNADDIDEAARIEEARKGLILPPIPKEFSYVSAAWEKSLQRLGITKTPPPEKSILSREPVPFDYVSYSEDESRLFRIAQSQEALYTSQKQLNELKVKDIALSSEMEQITHRWQMVDQNYTVTQMQRQKVKRGLLAEQEKAYNDQITSLNEQNALLAEQRRIKEGMIQDSTDAKEREKLEKEIVTIDQTMEVNSLSATRIGNQRDLGRNAAGPDMGSYFAMMETGIVQMQDAFGSFQMQAASVTLSIADNLSAGLGGAFSEIIMGTKTVGQAFADMGLMFMNAMVSAIMEVMAKWLVMKALMMVFNIGTGGAGGLLGGLLGFASGGRIPAGERLVRVNEQGSEYVVSSRSPMVNDAWLDYANAGGRLDELAAVSNVAPAAPAKTVIVRSQAEIRNEWKRGGLLEFVNEGIGKRGLKYA